MGTTKKEPSQELVKAEEPGALEQVPDFIEAGTRSGLEHLTREDIQMPRLCLAQQMSPELVDGDPKYIEGLRLGNLFNNLTSQIYGDGPLDFCVLRADPPRWVEFNPREAGGGIKDPNVSHGDPRTQFGPNGEPPIATKFYDFILMLVPSREMIALSLKSTGLKVAKQLNGLMAMRSRGDIFAGRYKVVSTMTKNAKGRFAIYQVSNAGWLPDKETYDYAKQMHLGLKDKTVHISHDDADTFDVEAIENMSPAEAAAAAAARATAGDVEGM